MRVSWYVLIRRHRVLNNLCYLFGGIISRYIRHYKNVYHRYWFQDGLIINRVWQFILHINILIQTLLHILLNFEYDNTFFKS